MGDLGLIPRLGKSPGEGKGYPLQYSGLENSMDSIVHGDHKESDMTERLAFHLHQPVLIGKRKHSVTSKSICFPTTFQFNVVQDVCLISPSIFSFFFSKKMKEGELRLVQ